MLAETPQKITFGLNVYLSSTLVDCRWTSKIDKVPENSTSEQWG